MAKAHPVELRERVVEHVEEGHSHRATAAHFRVSVKFVNDMVILKRETGSLDRKSNPGRKGRGKLEPYKGWLRERVEEKGDITLDQLARELNERFGVEVHRWSVCRVLHNMNLSHKKDPLCQRAATCGHKTQTPHLENQPSSFPEQGAGTTGVH